MKRHRGRVAIAGMTVAERIRAAIELDMADLLDDADAPDDDAGAEQPTTPPAERELILGVDVFMMPDGSYSASPPPVYMDHDAMGRHLYRMMLTEVMKRQHPLPCQHDDRFTADPVPIAALPELRELCDGCPIRGHCRGYADHAHPDAGFWGGRDYSHRTNAEYRQIIDAHLARAIADKES